MISVVIPVYNEETQLSSLLQDLQKQKTLEKYEILVVDNNSTDSSVTVAQNYGVRIISEKKQGISWARRRGILEANGEIIAQIDADCRVNSDWLQNLTASFLLNKNVIFTHGMVRSSKNSKRSFFIFVLSVF